MTSEEVFEKFASQTETKKGLRKSSTQSLVIVLGSNGCQLLLRIASTAILARLLLPDQFGAIMMLGVIFFFGNMACDLSLSMPTIQKREITNQGTSNLFWINVLIGFALCLATYAATPWIAKLYEADVVNEILPALSLTFILKGASVQHDSLLNRQMKHGKKAIVNILSFTISTAIAIALAYLGYGVWALVWRDISRIAIFLAGSFAFCPWLPLLPSPSAAVRHDLRMGSQLTASNFLNSITRGIDLLLLGKFYGPAIVAIYRQPFQLISTPMNEIMYPIRQVSTPGLSMLQDDPNRYRNYFRRVQSSILIVTFPTCAFLAIFSVELTNLALGPNWKDSQWFFCAFALLEILAFTRMTLSLVLISLGRSKTIFALSTLQSVVMPIALGIGIFWSAKGIVIANAIASILTFIPTLHYSLKDSPISWRDFAATTAKPLFATVLMAAALFGLNAFPAYGDSADWLKLAIGAPTAALAFATTWLLQPGGPAEAKTIYNDIVFALPERFKPSFLRPIT